MLEGRQYYHTSLHVGGQAVLPYISCWRAGSITIHLPMLEGRQYYHTSPHVGGQAVLPYISSCWRAGSISKKRMLLARAGSFKVQWAIPVNKGAPCPLRSDDLLSLSQSHSIAKVRLLGTIEESWLVLRVNLTALGVYSWPLTVLGEVGPVIWKCYSMCILNIPIMT